MKPPKPIEVDAEELSALKERVASGAIQEGDREILQRVITALIFLSRLLEAKNTSIKRLRKMLFGSKTEKASEIQDPPDDECGGGGIDPGQKPKKRKGHGRNGADAYFGAKRITIAHQALRHEGPCPECPNGKVYLQNDPGIIVRVRGEAPLQADVYELEKLRCNLCGIVFTARAPEEASADKYDETARAMIVLLKYGAGFPFYRLEKLQESLGIPLPSSTQWDQVEKLGDKAYPTFEELIRQAAQGDIVYNDDTTNKILELIKENKTEDQTERTGIFTTGIVSTTDDLKIAIFHTGRRHAKRISVRCSKNGIRQKVRRYKWRMPYLEIYPRSLQPYWPTATPMRDADSST